MEKSNISKRIISYLSDKYCSKIASIGLIKCIACAAMFVTNEGIQPLSVLCVAPTQQLKSRTSIELNQIFNPDSLIDLGSDFTIHGLIAKYNPLNSKEMQNETDIEKKKSIIDKKTCLINDLTLLLASKEARSKQRLINALAEVMSEGHYIYSERLEYLELIARTNFIANMTDTSYHRNYEALVSNTFSERMLTVFYFLSNDEMKSINIDWQRKYSVTFGKPITLEPTHITNLDEQNEKIADMAHQYKDMFTNASELRLKDIIISFLCGHACLNKRKEILPEDYSILELFTIKDMFLDVVKQKYSKFIKYYFEENQNIDFIKSELHISQATVYRWLDQAEREGHIR